MFAVQFMFVVQFICSSCLHMTPLDRFSGAGASFLFLLVLLDLKLSKSKGEGVDGVRPIKGVPPYPHLHMSGYVVLGGIPGR